jgi:ABC-2 type transport system permease protein
MLHGLWRLTWLEMRIFAREPLGVIGTVVMPVALLVLVGRILGDRLPLTGSLRGFLTVGLPAFAAILIVLNAVLSLTTIIAIYRENGILKRLRATPLRPVTILLAHVLAKPLVTGLTLTLMVLAGRPYYPIAVNVPVVAFTVALLFSIWSILSIGFVIASLVPTARFAQTIGGILMYLMIPFSGPFTPIESFSPPLGVLSRLLPLTYAVSLLQGIWSGQPWSQHLGVMAALLTAFGLCTVLAAKVLRWE